MTKIKRYTDAEYCPIGCIDDDVFLHTTRLVVRFLSLNLKDFKDVERMLWLHDFEELGMKSDVNTVRKSDYEHKEAYKQIKGVSKPDNNLIKRFTEAGQNLKNGLPYNDDSACLAKVIDYVENPLIYYFWYTKWIMSGNYWDGKSPKESVFTFTYGQNIKFRNGIADSKISKKTKLICLRLLNDQLKTTVSLWEQVPNQFVPKIMQDEIHKMKTILKDQLS